MSEEIIDHYVDRAGVSDDTKFITGELKSVLDLFDKVNAKKINLGGAKGMKDISAAAKELKGVMDSLQKTAEAYNKTQLQEAKLRKESALAQKAEAQARKENAAAAIKEKQALDESGKEREKEKQRINEIGRAYIEYSKAAREASLKAKAYALTLGESNPVTVAAVKNAKEMNDILLRVDRAVGQNQRNVGNYKSAFDGLSVSFSQVARELPSLAVSAQTFALAISNNLPMVFDEIKKARVEIAALKAEGQAAPTLFQRIGASLISWNIGLSVGIALLTNYSGKIFEWVKGLFDSSAALLKAAKAQEEFNARRREGIENEKRYQSLIDNEAQDKFVRKQKEELELARARGASEKEILKLERDQLSTRLERAKLNFIPDQEFLGRKIGGSEEQLQILKTNLDKAKAAYQDFLKTGRAFGKVFEIGGEDYQKADKLLKNSFDFQGLLYEEQAAKVAEFYNAQTALRAKDIEIAKLEAEQRAGFFADELQYRADILKNISQLEESERITRLNARKEALKNEKAIIEGQYRDEIFAAKDNQVKIFEVNREYRFKRRKLEEEYARDVLAIRQTSLQRQRELDQQYNEQFREDQADALDKQIENIQKEQERRLMESAKGQEAEIAALNKWYEKRVAATKEGSKRRQKVDEEYAKRRAEIEYQYAVAAVKNEIWAAEEILKVRKAAGIDVTKQEQELANLKMRLSDLETKHFIDNEKRKAKTIKERMEETAKDLQQVLQIQQTVSSLISGLISANVDREKNVIQDQIDDIDKKKEKEIDAINASAKTEQEKAVEIIKVKETAAAQKEQLERKQRQLDLQRARFEKAANLTRIAVETALAVVHQLATGDPYTAIGRAIAAGALGAAQFAVAAAQPLPKFKHGRKDGPATFGVVGDGGVNEVIYSPDLKHAMVTPDTDTIAYIPKGYGVASSIEEFQKTAMKMAHKELPVMPFIQQNNNDDLIHAMAYEIGSLKRAIMGKQETYFHWHNGELQKSIKKGSDWWRYIQNNI